MLNDWQEAGLIKPSAVRGVLAAVDKSDVMRNLGRLSFGDFGVMERAVGSILGLTLAIPLCMRKVKRIDSWQPMKFVRWNHWSG